MFPLSHLKICTHTWRSTQRFILRKLHARHEMRPLLYIVVIFSLFLLLFDCEYKHLTRALILLPLSFALNVCIFFSRHKSDFSFFSSLLLAIEWCRIRKTVDAFYQTYIYLRWLYKPWLLLLLLATYCWHEWESASFYVMWNMRQTQPDSLTHSLIQSEPLLLMLLYVVHINILKQIVQIWGINRLAALLRLCHIAAP